MWLLHPLRLCEAKSSIFQSSRSVLYGFTSSLEHELTLLIRFLLYIYADCSLLVQILETWDWSAPHALLIQHLSFCDGLRSESIEDLVYFKSPPATMVFNPTPRFQLSHPAEVEYECDYYLSLFDSNVLPSKRAIVISNRAVILARCCAGILQGDLLYRQGFGEDGVVVRP
jgi:hypothetical protein